MGKDMLRGLGLFNKNIYIRTGWGLLVAGSLVFLPAYFIFSQVWLMTLGAAMVILAFICLALGRTIPRVSPETSALLLETGIDNISSLMEELSLQTKCVYLPSSLTSGRPQALIPLHSNPSLPPITKALPQRLIVRYGIQPDDVGLLVSTLGTVAASLLESVPANTAAEIELALTRLFRGTLGIADSVRVFYHDDYIQVEIRNPHFEDKYRWSQQCLGGPLASVVATVVAEAWKKPVTIRQEEQHRGKLLVELEILP